MTIMTEELTTGSLLSNKVDQLLKSSISDSGLPFALATITDKKKDLYQGYFGYRSWETKDVVDSETLVLLASATKPVTAVAALQLYEQGRLNLDAPASIYVPDIKKLQVLKGWRDDGSPITRPPETEITVRHLLTHTSGLSYEIWNADVVRYMEHQEIPSLVTLDRKCLFTPLIAEPGTKWEYGISMDWVGQIIEAISGQPLESYFQEHIFSPLGMKNTSFRLPENKQNRLGKIHVRQSSGKLQATDFIAEQQGDFEEAGGGLYSTCRDYSTFLRMILNNGMGISGPVLKTETVELLKNNAIGPLRVTGMKTVSPDDSNDAEFFPGLEKTWSLGFMRNETKAPTGRNAGSLAWAGLFNVYFWIDPKAEIAGVFATQVQPFTDTKSLDTFLEFERLTYRHLVKDTDEKNVEKTHLKKLPF